MKKTVSVLLILAALFLAASPISVTASASAGELTLDEAADIVRDGWQFYHYYACEGYLRSLYFMPHIGNEIKVSFGKKDMTYYQLGKDGYTTLDGFKKEMTRYFDAEIADKVTGSCYACRLRGIDHPMFYEKDGIWYKAYCGSNSNIPNGSVWNVYDLKVNGDRATVNAVMSIGRYNDDPDRDFALEIVLKRGSNGWRISEEGDLIRLMCGELSWEEYSTTHPAPKVSHDTDKFTYTEACDLVRRGGTFYSYLQFNNGLPGSLPLGVIHIKNDECLYELSYARIPRGSLDHQITYSNADEALAMAKQYFTDEIAEGSVTYCLAELGHYPAMSENGAKVPLFVVDNGVTYQYVGGWQSQYNPGDIYYARNFRCDGTTATMDVVLYVAGGAASGPYFTTSITFVKTTNGWRIGDCDYTKLAMSKIDRFEYATEHRTDPAIPLDNDINTATDITLAQAVTFVREAAGFFYHLQYAPSYYSTLASDKLEVELSDGSVMTYDPLSSSDGYMTVDECRDKAGKYFVSGTLDRMLGNCRFCANNGKTHPVFYVKDGVTYKARCSYQPVFKQTDFRPTDIDDARNFRLSGDRAVFTATLFNYNTSSSFDVDIVLVKTADGWRIDDCDYLKLALYELDLNEYSRTHPVTAPPTGDGAGIKIFALSALALASVAVLVRALPRRRKYDEV